MRILNDGEQIKLLVNKVGLPLTGQMGKVIGHTRAKFDPDYVCYWVQIIGYRHPFLYFEDEVELL